MGAHTRSMSWYMGTPSSPGTGSGSSTGEAQHALSSSGGAGGGSDASFDTNMVIILAALLFALLFALGLNSLARLVIRGEQRGARLARLLRHVEVLKQQRVHAVTPAPAPMLASAGSRKQLRAGLEDEVIKNGVRARLLRGVRRAAAVATVGVQCRIVFPATGAALGVGGGELEGGEGVGEVVVRVRPEVKEGLGAEGLAVLLVDAERAARRARRSGGRRGVASLDHGCCHWQ
uniref:Uncharacterized protein n=1 Tax=Oryza brachyantha TaxID=4533 RepID=J3MHQ5_ORYBR